MNYSFLLKLFLTGLCLTALGIYSIQSGFLDVTDDIRRLLPSGYDPTTLSWSYLFVSFWLFGCGLANLFHGRLFFAAQGYSNFLNKGQCLVIHLEYYNLCKLILLLYHFIWPLICDIYLMWFHRVYDRNIGPFPSKNRSSCSCKGYALNAQNVPVDELEDLQRRRSEEYRQYQLRSKNIPVLSPYLIPITLKFGLAKF